MRRRLEEDTEEEEEDEVPLANLTSEARLKKLLKMLPDLFGAHTLCTNAAKDCDDRMVLSAI